MEEVYGRGNFFVITANPISMLLLLQVKPQKISPTLYFIHYPSLPLSYSLSLTHSLLPSPSFFLLYLYFIFFLHFLPLAFISFSLLFLSQFHQHADILSPKSHKAEHLLEKSCEIRFCTINARVKC